MKNDKLLIFLICVIVFSITTIAGLLLFHNQQNGNISISNEIVMENIYFWPTNTTSSTNLISVVALVETNIPVAIIRHIVLKDGTNTIKFAIVDSLNDPNSIRTYNNHIVYGE